MDEATALERLVRAYSPSSREAGAVRTFVALARSLGYRASIDRAGNGIATVGSGRPELWFLGHIDTVPGRRPVRWRARRLHGRGVVDAKGPLVAALFAGARRAGPGTLRVIAAVGEETDSRGARALLRGRPPDGVIAGEPSGGSGVTIGYKGILRVTATFRGRRRHYAGPEPTAADRAIDWVAAVRAWSAAQAGTSGFRSPSVKAIRLAAEPGGDAERATVALDVRLPPGLSVARARQALLGAAPGATLRALAAAEPFETTSADPVVGALVRGIRGTGRRPTLWRKSGTSDLNLAVAAWTVPGAAYGPGDARLDHTAREALSRAELARSIRVLRGAFDELLGGPDRPPTLRRSAGGA